MINNTLARPATVGSSKPPSGAYTLEMRGHMAVLLAGQYEPANKPFAGSLSCRELGSEQN